MIISLPSDFHNNNNNEQDIILTTVLFGFSLIYERSQLRFELIISLNVFTLAISS